MSDLKMPLKKRSINTGYQLAEMDKRATHQNSPQDQSDPEKDENARAERRLDAPLTHGEHLDSVLEVSRIQFHSVPPGSLSKHHPGLLLTRRICELIDDSHLMIERSEIDFFKKLGVLPPITSSYGHNRGQIEQQFPMVPIKLLIEKVPSLYDAILEVASSFQRHIFDHGRAESAYAPADRAQGNLYCFPVVESPDGVLRMYRIGAGYRCTRAGTLCDAEGMFVLVHVARSDLYRDHLNSACPPGALDSKLIEVFRKRELLLLTERLHSRLRALKNLRFKQPQVFEYVENELSLLEGGNANPNLNN